MVSVPVNTAPATSDLKGRFYLSQQQNGDQLFQEGVFTIFNEIDEIRRNLNQLMRPNGSQSSPARSCYDLFLCNRALSEGYYWIDPNLGSIDDAVQVYCSKPGCSCLDCSHKASKMRQWAGFEGGAKSFTQLEGGFGLQCPVHSDQLGLLQLLSTHASQRLTYVSKANTESVVVLTNTGLKLPTTDSHIQSTKMADRTEFQVTGEPEWFPIADFVPGSDKFGFELSQACFCNELP